MKILDKNTDFYDYIQYMYPDDCNVFDRTDSFMMSKEDFCHLMYGSWHRSNEAYYDLALLQIGNVFFLFLVHILKVNSYGFPLDYELELIAKWSNYDKPRKLIQLDRISLSWEIVQKLQSLRCFFQGSGYDREAVLDNIGVIMFEIDHNNHKVEKSANKHVIRRDDGTKVEKHIPLFAACGIGQLLDPMEVFMALDEYFSKEKSDAERTDAEGTTNKDKIVNHGFDAKTSFRNAKK